MSCLFNDFDFVQSPSAILRGPCQTNHASIFHNSSCNVWMSFNVQFSQPPSAISNDSWFLKSTSNSSVHCRWTHMMWPPTERFAASVEGSNRLSESSSIAIDNHMCVWERVGSLREQEASVLWDTLKLEFVILVRR
eukprot:1577124-Amphidinium_carterae.1